MRRHAPAVTAFLLAPVLAELLTSASPPREFFRPVTLAMLLLLHGCGVLLCHDLALRWRRGWPGILVLGVAYAVVHEGLCCKSFFNADWPTLGLLGSYGRFLGINWVWSLCLIAFHALISIALPVVIVELLWPESKNHLWVENATIPALELGLGAMTLCGLVLFPCRPAPGAYLAGVALTAWLVRRARTWRPRRARPLPPLRPWVVGLYAGLVTLLLVLAMYGPAKWKLIVFFPEIAMVWFWWAAARRTARRVAGGWSERHALALVTGPLCVLIPLAAGSEWLPGRPDDPSGMTVVALAAAVSLLLLRRRVRRRALRGVEFTGPDGPPAGGETTVIPLPVG